jgi:hypothetical protein
MWVNKGFSDVSSLFIEHSIWIFLLMNHYERLATRYVFLKQDARVVGKKVKDLTEQRKRLNKEVRVLGKVLEEMRRYPVSTFFDHWTEEELDEKINEFKRR